MAAGDGYAAQRWAPQASARTKPSGRVAQRWAPQAGAHTGPPPPGDLPPSQPLGRISTGCMPLRSPLFPLVPITAIYPRAPHQRQREGWGLSTPLPPPLPTSHLAHMAPRPPFPDGLFLLTSFLIKLVRQQWVGFTHLAPRCPPPPPPARPPRWHSRCSSASGWSAGCSWCRSGCWPCSAAGARL